MYFNPVIQIDDYCSFIWYLACNYARIYYFKKLLWRPSTCLPNPNDFAVLNKLNI